MTRVLLHAGWMQATGWWTCQPDECREEEWFDWTFADEMTAQRFLRHALELWPHGGVRGAIEHAGRTTERGAIPRAPTMPNRSVQEIESYLARLELWITENDPTT